MNVSHNNISSSEGSLAQAIARKISDGSLKQDAAQKSAIAALDTLLLQMRAPPLGNKKSSLGWLFGKKKRQVTVDQSQGAYLWGGVGRGKSMLMDMFYDLAPCTPKRRVHFHAFMPDVHKRVHIWRQEQTTGKDRSADPIPPLALALSQEAKLLCFDEFAVSDVADAMILARLFTGLFALGVTVVTTSNVKPDNLYKDGLNRSFFLPFIDLVKTKMQVVEFASSTDYRMETLINSDVYMTGAGSYERYEALWEQLTMGLTIAPVELEVLGRHIVYEQASGKLLRTDFTNLCEKPLGAGDYLALADRFNTVFLESVPVMDQSSRNAVKRFINLVDTLYDKGTLLIVQAAVRPSKLYLVEYGNEAFEFQRTVSRLREMQGEEWLSRDRN